MSASNVKIGNFNRHLIKQSLRSKKGKKVLVAGLMLTSMVDMFSLLVIFLLQSFSNSPQVIEIKKGITLPAALSAGITVDAPVLAVSATEVVLDQKKIGVTSEVLRDPAEMIRILQELRGRWVQAHPTEKFVGEIHLQADRLLSAPLISEFMSILNSQSYTSIQLAVVAGGGS